jgi:hypothetical protein
MAEQFKDGLEHLPLRERIAARAKAVAEMAAELTGTSPGRSGDMDTLRDKLNETSGLAKLLFEQQFIRHGGRKPADPEWSDLDESERDEWWDRALDAGPLIEGERFSRQAWADRALSDEQTYRELLGSIWLYVDWRYVTKQLTTEQKNLWADAVDTTGDPDFREPKAERWWDRQCSCGHGPDRHEVISETPGCRDCGCMWFLQKQSDEVAFCACVPDGEAAALVEAGFTRPQCTVHPDGGAA